MKRLSRWLGEAKSIQRYLLLLIIGANLLLAALVTAGHLWNSSTLEEITTADYVYGMDDEVMWITHTTSDLSSRLYYGTLTNTLCQGCDSLLEEVDRHHQLFNSKYQALKESNAEVAARVATYQSNLNSALLVMTKTAIEFSQALENRQSDSSLTTFVERLNEGEKQLEAILHPMALDKRLKSMR